MQNRTNFIYCAMRRVPLVPVVSAWIWLTLVSCTVPVKTSDGGSGTGVGNGVVMGKVIYADSTPVQGALVRLRTQQYLADTSGTVLVFKSDTVAAGSTDMSGLFIIDSVDTGKSYVVEVIDTKQQVLGTLYKSGHAINDTIKLGTHVVKPVTRISGTIVLSGLPQNAYVQIYGLERLGRTDTAGWFEINELPIGECEHGECEYKLRFFAPLATGGVKVVETELEIKADPNGNVLSIEMEFESGN